ncbi:MAG: hypothetical protein QUV08_07145 [Parasphingorhabdus sp.]|nr:hypothetical protein [Parasphingorhabdus sp.]
MDQGGKLLVDHGIKHDAGSIIDRAQHGEQLLAASDERIDMLDRLMTAELGGYRAAGRDQRFARRIGDQMQVKEVFPVFHDVLRLLFITLENPGRKISSGFRLWAVRVFIHICSNDESVKSILLKTGTMPTVAPLFRGFYTGFPPCARAGRR